MKTYNITFNLKEDQSLSKEIQRRLDEYLATWRHTEILEQINRNFALDESNWKHVTIAIYTGFNLYCNPSELNQEDEELYYKNYEHSLKDFCDIVINSKAYDLIKANLSFILTADNSTEMFTITITDDFIHIYQINTGQW